ncbi:hypothetical protein L0U85_03675 [Glycomyces sp. L485]|uniref:hypothetical protein n=1 Tax=Glycomyces sp. L485 TaxID=2909235 RepID=UPI001F4B03FD|nr:hypothetical protein [Glycomyces sp. L485]MCH7229961.1 hypothetical protein [Glycomyces sp. L485]
MLAVVARLAGAPGVTLTCLGLAAAWPGEDRPTVVELDPLGGDVAARWRVRAEPGLSDVAAVIASEPQAGPEALAEGVQRLLVAGTQVPVVCSAAGGAAARRALEFFSLPGSKVLSPPEGTVIADVGRLDLDSPCWPVTASADAVVIVVEGTLASIAHLRARQGLLEDLAGLGPRIGIVVVEREYTADEVNEVFLAAGFEPRVIGAAGPLDVVGPEIGVGRRARRAWSVWRAVAVSVRDFAAEGPLALTAAPHGVETEEERP